MRSIEGENANSKTQSRVFSHLSATLIGIIFVFGIIQFDLDNFKGILVDSLFRMQWFGKVHPDIALIAYDDPSSSAYYGSRKIPAEEIAGLFDVLSTENPQAVGIVSTINNKIYSEVELETISAALAKIPNTVVGYIDDDSFSKVQMTNHLRGVRYLPGFVSRDTFSYGADSVSRRTMITVGALPTLYGELARIYLNADRIPAFRHAHHYQKNGPLQVYTNWQGSAGTYPMHSSRAVVGSNFSPGTFTNKIILIGSVLSVNSQQDFIKTPYSRTPGETSTLEGAAHGLATLMRDNAIFKSPPWFNLLLTLVVGILTVNMVLFLSPIRGILFVLGEVACLYLCAWLGFAVFQCWIDLAHPFIVSCFGYYLVIPYRLVNEYRTRWHYQQKSEMMAQLEQLKTNFLNLVSHDLKTPIARIQGNAELLLTHSLDKGAKKSLNAIVQTTEGLSEHVETILDITRIESAQVPVQKRSRDINATIVEVVESRRYLAKEKDIQLITSMEPIFSFKFDVKLIRRVILNLVENAIKYSPSGSTIAIASSEEDSWIRVSVTDQGQGIPANEQERIFTKFYRCDNEPTKQAKGTGLGLYLVKYFTELHSGFVKLESEVGQGSKFTISLPT